MHHSRGGPWRALGAAAMLLTFGRAGSADEATCRGKLPMFLDLGWEASDEDPADGVAGLDRLSWRPGRPAREPGPQGTVRWYRIRLDLSACRGIPLAFHTAAIRDVDEAYLDGVRIGGKGGFPPRFESASMMVRLYRLPTDLANEPGPHWLALRVYHAPSPSSVIRTVAVIDELTVTRHRAWVDQTLAAVTGIGLSLAIALILFHAVQKDARKNAILAFAAFTVLVVVYLVCGHSAWSSWPVPTSLPFRVAAVSGALLCAVYALAVWRLLAVAPPLRFRAYWAGFLLYALLAATLPDLGLLVVPTNICRTLAFVCLADLVAPTVRAAKAGHRGAWVALCGHSAFGLGIVWLNLTLLPVAWFYSCFGLALLLVAVSLYGVAMRQMQARMAAVVAERSRLAREIHDTLAQGLAGISMQLESVAETLVSSPEEAQAHLDRARTLARGSLTEARRSVWELRPRALDDGDLVKCLAAVVDQHRDRPLPVRLAVKGESARLAAETESNLLRIAQEAITNAVRHAQAGAVEVELAFGRTDLALRVRDDGRGFEVPAVGTTLNGHFGLLGMHERAERIGGRLSLVSRPGQGTEVSVSVPMSSAPARSR
jgi:signal transduction histidine kinase